MKKRVDYELQTGEFKSDIRLAKFWRFGYWICAFILAAFLDYINLLNFLFWVGLFIIGHSIYTFIIMKKPKRYFTLGMLNYERKEMKISGSEIDMFTLDKWRREEHIRIIIFITIGLIFIIASFFE